LRTAKNAAQDDLSNRGFLAFANHPFGALKKR